MGNEKRHSQKTTGINRVVRRKAIWFFSSLAVWLAMWAAAPAMDRVVFQHDGHQTEVTGRIVVEAQDGGLLLLGRDGVLWTIQPKQKISQTGDEEPFAPLSRKELAQKILAELPPGFSVHETNHYLIFFNSSRVYAQWCGSLFERLYMAFSNYWKRRGLELPEPEFPLVAIVFGDQVSYQRYAQRELGKSARSILGYYGIDSNRMTMCDLTGISSLARGQKAGSTAQINQILSRPEAQATVATIVHEATHQIAYNRGVHGRYSDCPLWLVEGIAVYFETPDLSSNKGWSGIGGVNRMRLVQFAQYLQHRPADSLATLISNDKRLRNSSTALDAYAEAWALTYFLIRNRKADYLKYLKQIGKKKPMRWDTPEKRLNQFEAIFGDLEKLDREFLRYMQRSR